MTDLIFWMFVDLSESQICRLRLIRTYLVMTWLEGLKGNLWMCVDLNRKGRISYTLAGGLTTLCSLTPLNISFYLIQRMFSNTV